jgi:tetratricopeptide (TPR) repeat protein
MVKWPAQELEALLALGGLTGSIDNLESASKLCEECPDMKLPPEVKRAFNDEYEHFDQILPAIYNAIGKAYKEKCELDKAVSYFDKSMETIKKLREKYPKPKSD